MENFWQDCTRFELVAATKDLNENQRKVVLSTLPRGKLVDIYTTLDEETCGDLHTTLKGRIDDTGWAVTGPFSSCSIVYVLLPKTL